MQLLSYLPFYPLISFLLLITFSKRLAWWQTTILSVGAVLLSAISAGYVVITYITGPESVLQVELFQWFMLGDVPIHFTLYLDNLSAVMTLVVSGVGFLIHAYAAAYMRDDENFSRFMAYMNLFIVAMLLLVLGDSLVLLYLGWEGVGLCSFLLIGFWYQDKANAMAAKKAFIVTRIGDTFLAIGLFLIFRETSTLNIQDIQSIDGLTAIMSNDMQFWICVLLVGGAVGKSAQLPLQTWLPDAMAGPTPVSALIHAATMVTAGVYLIARMNGIFLLTPEVMQIVSWIGGFTLLLAGFAALAQRDIKRILAYSTMSQIGYMMLALGAGAFSAGVMHLMTHAFFKALLFLTAGAIILTLHHQQNIFKMGGLLKKLPFTSLLFFIGIAALIALPGTSGFVSKEAIIAQLYSSTTAGPVFWWMAIVGALFTSIYSFRLILIAFLGDYRGDTTVQSHKSWLMFIPLVLLATLSILGGYIELDLSGVFINSVSHLQSVAQGDVQSGMQGIAENEPHWLHTVAIATPFVGAAIALLFYYPRKNTTVEDQNKELNKVPNKEEIGFFESGLGFDSLYHVLFVIPFVFIAKLNKSDVIDTLVKFIGWNVVSWHDSLKATQNGQLRWYLAMLALGIIVLLAIVIRYLPEGGI